jgi:hypothetical protein
VTGVILLIFALLFMRFAAPPSDEPEEDRL